MQFKSASVCFVAFLALTVSVAHAQLGYITVTDGSTDRCTINTEGQFSVVVMLTVSVPVTEVYVVTSPPACLDAFLVSEGPVGGLQPVGADIRSGMSFPLGGCSEAPIALYQFDYIALGTTGDCCIWDVEYASITDCYGETSSASTKDHVINRTAACTCAWGGTPGDGCTWNCDSAQYIEPHSPFPAPGATGVPPDAQLSFVVPDAPIDVMSLYFGLATSPSSVYSGPVISSFDPGPLQPNTEYRWYVIVPTQPQDPHPLYSDWWTFTTGDPVRTEPISWGAIKALYE